MFNEDKPSATGAGSSPGLKEPRLDHYREKLIESVRFRLRDLSNAELEQMGQFFGQRNERMAEEAAQNKVNIGNTGGASARGRLTLDNIERVMQYQDPGPEGIRSMATIREALTFAAQTILRDAPDSASRDRALLAIIHARMEANMAISFHGQF